MSTTAQIPMIEISSGNPGMVDADKVEAATASGKYEPAAKMVGPKGEIGYVAQSKVPAARQSNYSVTPDNPGMARMADPSSGTINYVLPSEVDNFKSLGHVQIDDKGNFNVEPLPGEDNTATMDRAAKLTQKLPPEVIKKALAAEQKTFTAKHIAASLAAGPAIAAVQLPATLGASAGVGTLISPTVVPVAGGAGFGGAAASEVLGPSVGATVAREAGKFVLKHWGKMVLGAAIGAKWGDKIGKLF